MEKKVIVCGGIVVVVACGIYACCRLRRGRSIPTSAPDRRPCGLRAEALLDPLLQGNKAASLGETWRGSERRSLSSKDVNRDAEKDLEGAPHLESEPRRSLKFDIPETSGVPPAISDSHCCVLHLKVIVGPSLGRHIEKNQGGSLTVGRVPENDLVLNNPEVSGKHVSIAWKPQAKKWELVDLGSLNGTLVNDHVANEPERQPGRPVALSNGDIVTLGSSSQLLVTILASHFSVASAPFEVGMASAVMSVRANTRRRMEDFYHCEWPLRGPNEAPFGIFCVFDGHGGFAAAEAASRIMPQKMREILAVEETRSGVLRRNDASDVLRDALQKTEEALDYEYEGCTATVLLLWKDSSTGFAAQCANVGDSHCIVSNGGEQVLMTEDHRVVSQGERVRLLAAGIQLTEGQNRLNGLNLARALGDKFVKGEAAGFSSQPFVSNVFRLTQEGKGLVVIASDGLWDELKPHRALRTATEARDGLLEDGLRRGPWNAQSIASFLVTKAQGRRTLDDITVLILDFAPLHHL